MPSLANTGALKHLEGKEKLLLRLVDLSVQLNSTLDLDELLQLITATATELLECEAASILLYDEKSPRLFFAAATGSNPVKLAEIPVPIDNSLAGTIFRTNKPLILNDADQDPRHYAPVSEHIKFKTKTLLGVPMPIKDQVMGVLEAVNKHSGNFDESDSSVLSVIAAHAAIAINNARLFKARQQALEKVRETNQIKSNFLALASHELRTPLGIIIGYSAFLQEEARGASSEHVKHVLGAASQMRSILDQMNNLTLLQTDEMTMRPMKIPMQDILNFAIDEIKYIASRQDLTLVYAFEEKPPLFAFADPEKTTLAFVNLLTNAVRFSNDGGEVTIGAVKQDKHILVWVQDKGKGIPADKLQKVFEEFYQIEPPNTRSYGGLGIGLSISKGLIESQGGKIWAESEGLGKGTTFKALFPLRE
ncbi:MAG: GAF domain-containing sensor histidine kinase [Chloroflexi bacterium]|nr:GAF domain-containing sensor histidine kinase [Chloroflexota bacterium]